VSAGEAGFEFEFDGAAYSWLRRLAAGSRNRSKSLRDRELPVRWSLVTIVVSSSDPTCP
jgi:hypothetical protein